MTPCPGAPPPPRAGPFGGGEHFRDRHTGPRAARGVEALRRRHRTARGGLPRLRRRGHGPRRRQRRRQVDADQVRRRHPPDRRRRDPVRRPARAHPRAEGRRQARHRGRLPGPRPGGQPRRRPEHVLRARGAHVAGTPRRDQDGAPGGRHAQEPVGDDDPLRAADRRRAVRRPAPVGRRRQGGHVELARGDPRRADRGARRRADAAGARARQAPRRAGPGRGPDLPQPARHLRGRRQHHCAAPRPERGRVQAHGDQPAEGGRGDHRRPAVQGAGSGGRRMSTVTEPPVAPLLLPDGNELPTAVAVALALGAGLAIGTLHGVIITKVGIPSFVVTLAGLLGWNGIVLLLIGSRGTVILQNDFTIGLANDFLGDSLAWTLVIVCTALYGLVQFARVRSRHKAGLPAEPMLLPALRVLGLFAALAVVTAVANQDRGIPWVLVIVGVALVWWTFVLRRTRFGRHIYAVGGNIEAARRAGISTDRIKIACFALCSFMAAVGGIVLASRLRSVDTNAGGGPILLYSIAAAVIGGTSLFGGRGHMKSAVLGALVIGSIDNGLGLLGLSSGTKFVVTGAVLLLAVAVDSISRKGREHAGRA